MSKEQSSPPPPTPEAKRSGRKWLWVFVVGGIVATVAGLLVNRYFVNPPLSPDDPPEKVYQKIFAAYGGQEALDRWKCGELKYENFIDGRVATGSQETPSLEVSASELFSLPGGSRSEVRQVREPQDILQSFGANGRVEWARNKRGEIDVQPSSHFFENANYPVFLRYYHPHAVLYAGEGLAIRGVESGSDGRSELVIEIVGSGPPTTRCRVDRQTKLIREVRGRIPPPFKGEGNARLEYSDYRKTEGGMVPGRITAYIEDKRLFEYRFLSVEFRDHINPTLFDPPSK